jgi:hypothetical protein
MQVSGLAAAAQVYFKLRIVGDFCAGFKPVDRLLAIQGVELDKPRPSSLRSRAQVSPQPGTVHLTCTANDGTRHSKECGG